MIPTTKKLSVLLHVARLARRECVPRSDERIAWVKLQAEACVREGMSPGEAVSLAADLAFRRYGLRRASQA